MTRYASGSLRTWSFQSVSLYGCSKTCECASIRPGSSVIPGRSIGLGAERSVFRRRAELSERRIEIHRRRGAEVLLHPFTQIAKRVGITAAVRQTRGEKVKRLPVAPPLPLESGDGLLHRPADLLR